ncbi:MAG: PIN domain-containing protein [Nitrospirae bacterium]|jgi:predicted nucleic acid-binding protein|nr:PIN domain-containing protein [Nitrospirota bacterium]
MAKIKLLIDTDIFIDALKEVKPARELFKSKAIILHCSILTKKELLSKRGLKDSERREITNLLLKTRVLRIDDQINQKYFALIRKYVEKQDMLIDYLIAATAWAKNLSLLTRNRKHFEHIEEITLSPVYEIE